jgi:hypothetical protein
MGWKILSTSSCRCIMIEGMDELALLLEEVKLEDGESLVTDGRLAVEFELMVGEATATNEVAKKSGK